MREVGELAGVAQEDVRPPVRWGFGTFERLSVRSGASVARRPLGIRLPSARSGTANITKIVVQFTNYVANTTNYYGSAIRIAR